jgi:hypothetical protein
VSEKDSESEGGSERANEPVSSVEFHYSPELAALIEGPGEPLDQLDPTDHEALAGEDRRQDIKLKKTYAKSFLRLVALQLVVADLVFIAYAWAGKSWDLPSSVIEIWLGATLIELVGIVLVVTRYLFPRRDGSF